MKTVFVAIEEFARHSKAPIELLKSKGFNVLLNSDGIPPTIDNQAEAYLKADYVIAGLETYSDVFFKKFKNIKAISRVGVGVDAIDLNSAKTNDVKIFVTSDRPSVAVSELCIANMISLLRHTFLMSNDLKLNKWNPIQGIELRSCTVGIVGLGSIGKEVAKRVYAFGSKIIASGRTWNNEFANTFGITRKSIEEIFEESNIVTIHLPLTADTKQLIDKKLLAKVKPGTVILNTSRAGVMDNHAVAEAIRLKHLSGAAIDVFEEDKDPYPYSSLENVILTPHIGSHTLETRKAMEEMAAQNLIIFDSYLENNKDLEAASYISKHSVI